MKKLILMLMLTMTSLISNAQTTIEAYASEFGVWDSEQEEWLWEDYKFMLAILPSLFIFFMTELLTKENTYPGWQLMKNKPIAR